MLLEAIKTAGTTETDKVREALQNIDYPGVTGQTKFDEIGDVQKAFVKVTVKDGQFVQL